MNEVAARNREYQTNSVSQPVQMPTIATAVGRLEALNDRMPNISRALDQISDQIGGPRPVAGVSGSTDPAPGGAVHRLHEGLSSAHTRAGDIEDTLKAISRALG